MSSPRRFFRCSVSRRFCNCCVRLTGHSETIFVCMPENCDLRYDTCREVSCHYHTLYYNMHYLFRRKNNNREASAECRVVKLTMTMSAFARDTIDSSTLVEMPTVVHRILQSILCST